MVNACRCLTCLQKNEEQKKLQTKENIVLTWDECFVSMARIIALRSKDPRTQAGAVIVNQNNVVLGLGYNGFPRGIENDDFPWCDGDDFLNAKYAYVVHAEANAVYNSNGSVQGSKIYCTLFPCNECTKALIQVGIKEVIFECDKHHDENSYIASRRLLDVAGITYRQFISDVIKAPIETVLGVTGTNASGKDTVADHLKQTYGFRTYSLSDEIRAELTKKGLPHTRENLIAAGNELRQKFLPNELAVRTLERIRGSAAHNIIITSIRNPAEIDEFKRNFPKFKMVFVDAPVELRFERARARGKIGEGNSLQTFKTLEEKELQGNKNEQQLLVCAERADFSLINDSTLEDLYNKIGKLKICSK
ncbi:MAG: AAA family ATPase [Candidatus Vogelbacteria bacterium]|nr:AAA family ATPase [Candidatus Vogelbacteria bacterium]